MLYRFPSYGDLISPQKFDLLHEIIPMGEDYTVIGKKSERFKFAQGKQTIGQKLYGLTPEALGQLLLLIQGLFAQGHSCEEVLEVLMSLRYQYTYTIQPKFCQVVKSKPPFKS